MATKQKTKQKAKSNTINKKNTKLSPTVLIMGVLAVVVLGIGIVYYSQAAVYYKKIFYMNSPGVTHFSGNATQTSGGGVWRTSVNQLNTWAWVQKENIDAYNKRGGTKMYCANIGDNIPFGVKGKVQLVARGKSPSISEKTYLDKTFDLTTTGFRDYCVSGSWPGDKDDVVLYIIPKQGGFDIKHTTSTFQPF